MTQVIDSKGNKMAVSQGFEPCQEACQLRPTEENQQLTETEKADSGQLDTTFRHRFDTDLTSRIQRTTKRNQRVIEWIIMLAFWFLVLFAFTDPIISEPVDSYLDFECTGTSYLHPDCPNKIMDLLKELEE